MEEHDNNIKRKIDLIQVLFGCEPACVANDHNVPVTGGAEYQREMVLDQELLEFLNERDVLREQLHNDLSISIYLRTYDKLCQYGLDEYFMELLKWEINLKMGGGPDTFFSRDFELRYKNQEEMLELVRSLQE